MPFDAILVDPAGQSLDSKHWVNLSLDILT